MRPRFRQKFQLIGIFKTVFIRLYKISNRADFCWKNGLRFRSRNRKVRNTIFTCTKKRMFPVGLYFFISKILKKNFMVFLKKCNVYSAVHQLWSNTHQLVQISIVVRCLSFHTTNLQILDMTSFVVCIFSLLLITTHQ